MIEVEKDPWAHRSENMSCNTCMWYVPKMKSENNVPVVCNIGRCRRHAPTINGYPAVYMTDWCGDHKLDENKV